MHLRGLFSNAAGLDYTGHVSVHFYPADPFIRCHVVCSSVRESKIELVKNSTSFKKCVWDTVLTFKEPQEELLGSVQRVL